MPLLGSPDWGGGLGCARCSVSIVTLHLGPRGACFRIRRVGGHPSTGTRGLTELMGAHSSRCPGPGARGALPGGQVRPWARASGGSDAVNTAVWGLRAAWGPQAGCLLPLRLFETLVRAAVAAVMLCEGHCLVLTRRGAARASPSRALGAPPGTSVCFVCLARSFLSEQRACSSAVPAVTDCCPPLSMCRRVRAARLVRPQWVQESTAGLPASVWDEWGVASYTR